MCFKYERQRRKGDDNMTFLWRDRGEPRQGRLLRRYPHLRDGLRALHPRRGHRGALPNEDDHAEDAADAARAEAVQVPPQETGNRK